MAWISPHGSCNTSVITVTTVLFAGEKKKNQKTKTQHLSHTNIITNLCAISNCQSWDHSKIIFIQYSCPWTKAAKPETQDSRQEMRSATLTILTGYYTQRQSVKKCLWALFSGVWDSDQWTKARILVFTGRRNSSRAWKRQTINNRHNGVNDIVQIIQYESKCHRKRKQKCRPGPVIKGLEGWLQF